MVTIISSLSCLTHLPKPLFTLLKPFKPRPQKPNFYSLIFSPKSLSTLSAHKYGDPLSYKQTTNHDLVILGIETSCDDTAAAVVRSNGDILSQVVSSQGMRSSNSCRDKVLIFDPGGLVQNLQSEAVKNKFKDKFRSEVTLEEALVKSSVSAQFRPWEDSSLNFQSIEQLVKGPSQWQRKVFIIGTVNSATLQCQSTQKVIDQFDNIVNEINQQYVFSGETEMIVIPYLCTVLEPGSLENTRRLEDYDISRKRVLMTIFDPGGYIIGACYVQIICATAVILHSATIASGEKQLQMHDPP